MLQGKTILITGSSKGIGKATAVLAKSYGAEVILHGSKKTAELEEFASSLSAKLVTFDLSSREEIVEALKGIQKVEGLVNCAATPKVVPFMESTTEDWMKTFHVNVVGAVHVCQEIIPKMQQSGKGSIVNIASVRGHDSATGVFNTPYPASKAALKNISVSLAKQLGPDIRVNSVSPGFTNTGFVKTWNESVLKQANGVLMGRIGEPNEIAEMICFLLSDKSAFTTGQDFVVDGGLMASGIK